MRIGKIEVKRRIWIGLVFVLGITWVWVVWSRSRPAVARAAIAAKQPFVRLAGTGRGADDQLLRERADLFDPTPLFFPTEWNYGQRALPENMRHQPGQVFGSFEANFTFAEQNIKNYGAEAVAVPERLVDVLTQGNEKPFAGMGQIDVQRPPLDERSAFVEVKDLADGKIVLTQALNSITAPRSGFGPMELLVVVSSAGIVGEPVLMSESGLEEVDEDVDAFFRAYLVNSFRLGERLSPGRYRVLVGP